MFSNIFYFFINLFLFFNWLILCEHFSVHVCVISSTYYVPFSLVQFAAYLSVATMTCMLAACTLLALGWWWCMELDVPLVHAGYVTKALLVQRQRLHTTSPPKAESVSCKLVLVWEECRFPVMFYYYYRQYYYKRVLLECSKLKMSCIFCGVSRRVHNLGQ